MMQLFIVYESRDSWYADAVNAFRSIVESFPVPGQDRAVAGGLRYEMGRLPKMNGPSLLDFRR